MKLQELIDAAVAAKVDPVNVEIFIDRDDTRAFGYEPDVTTYDLPSVDGGARDDCVMILLAPGGGYVVVEEYLQSFGYEDFEEEQEEPPPPQDSYCERCESMNCTCEDVCAECMITRTQAQQDGNDLTMHDGCLLCPDCIN